MRIRNLQRVRKALLFAIINRSRPDIWLCDTAADMPSDDMAFTVISFDLIGEQALCGDGILLHPEHFGNVGDHPAPIAQARRVNDHVNRIGDHLADVAGWKIEPAAGDHGLKPTHRLARRVGMHRAHGPVMARVHSLQKIKGLAAAHLADDDPIRAHPQTVLHQIPHADFALTLKVGRAGFQRHDMRLLQLQFRGILAGYHETVTIDGRNGTHLPQGTNVKILDVAGNLVYETNVVEGQELQGGKVVWNKKNLAGNKVASGIYIVLLSNDDATETATTKIAIVN